MQCARAQAHTHSLLHKRGHCLPHTAPVQRPSPAPTQTVCLIFCPRPELPSNRWFLTRLSFFSGKHRTPFDFKIHTRRGCPFSLTPPSTALVPFFCANIRYFRSRLTNRPPPPCRPPQTNQGPPAPPTPVSYRHRLGNMDVETIETLLLLLTPWPPWPHPVCCMRILLLFGLRM